MRAFLGILLLLSGTFIASAMVLRSDFFHKDIEASIVEKVWQQDIDRLLQQKQLPSSWQQIREVRVTALSAKAARWLRHAKIPVHLNPMGLYQLEIAMDHNEESDSLAIITTYNLNDLRTKNTLWEFGRTYSIPNKKWLNLAQKWMATIQSFLPQEKQLSSLAPTTAAEEEVGEEKGEEVKLTPPTSSTSNTETNN